MRHSLSKLYKLKMGHVNKTCINFAAHQNDCIERLLKNNVIFEL